MTMTTQREMPFLAKFDKPKFVEQRIVSTFRSYREAVVWCWENRVNNGAGEKLDQALCANQIGLHTPHMSRCVSRDSGAPMNLSPDHLAAFEAFCGFRAASQYLVGQVQLTLLEQVMEERLAVTA